MIVGGGGREHAIAWRLSKDVSKHILYCAPGNAGTADIATNLPELKASDVDAIAAWCADNRPDLAVVGPEAPLCAGLADALAKISIPVFGPKSAGARMEGSKRFAKEIMLAAGVPTGAAKTFTDAKEAKAALPGFGLPVVIKADGLAAGKGVVVAETSAQAEEAIDDMLTNGKFGKSGAEILIEEFLHGEECSILAITDGKDAMLLPPSQDHKRVFDGDKGPNTGGMGAYSPAPVVEDGMLPEIKEKIIMPVIKELSKRGIDYRGVLYAGLMITPRGGKTALSGSRINVVEFNARFGDPETEAVLMRLDGDFAGTMLSAANGSLDTSLLKENPRAAATVIIASAGYPGSYEKGKVVSGLDKAAEIPHSALFHCGTEVKDGKTVTAGGRVFSASGTGESLREAVDRAYELAKCISFDGAFYRKDIAHRAFESRS